MGDKPRWDASAVDYTRLTPERRIALLTALQVARAQLDAREQVLLHTMATDPRPYDEVAGKDWIREDIACAMTLPPTVAGQRMTIASELVTRLPATLSTLGRGEISMRHARRLADAVCLLPDPAATEVEARVLERAAEQTLAQFSASVRRAVLAVDPREPDQQDQDAVAQRRVVITPQDDGTTELWALLPADGAAALNTRLDQLAAQAKGLDERTADQRRADALVQLALGGPGQALRPAVHVTVALSTLLDLDEQPGELDRHGPIPAALARALAFDPTGTWRRLVTDPHGNLVDLSSHTYRPPATMARLVKTRALTCCFPGCRQPATTCELDHLTAWDDGGPTTPHNLHPLCARHHHLKHDASWHVQRLPDGTTQWTTPTGHHYNRPPDHLPKDTTSDPPR